MRYILRRLVGRGVPPKQGGMKECLRHQWWPSVEQNKVLVPARGQPHVNICYYSPGQ